jgi:hypothetical protein
MAMRFRSSTILIVAPTSKRILIIWRKLRKVIPAGWVLPGKAGIRTSLAEIELFSGLVFKFVAAKSASSETGVPFAGIDAVAAAVDEEQDCSQEAMDELEMRGRDAPAGYFPVLSTCTLKDTAVWRARKEKYEKQKGCVVYRMLLSDNPFVPPSFIENLRHSLSPRAFRMRVLAEDVRPDGACYPDFERERHVRELPQLGIRDITHKVTGSHMVIGYDPGKRVDVSIFLRCYEIAGKRTWVVVDELTTEQGTAEYHAHKVLERLQAKWEMQHYIMVNGKPKRDPSERYAIIRADPYGNTESRPHVTVYREFQLLGITIKPAQYSVANTPQASGKPGKVPIEARINMVNTLLLNAAGDTRLLIAERDGKCVAPKLRDALDMSARNERGDAEHEKKGTAGDISHWCAALGYGLWPYEKARLSTGIDAGVII